MMDATFQDGAEKPLRLKAFETADLDVISSLIQDAVFPVVEMSWLANQRRFAILLNRYRWETEQGHAPERVQSVLAFEDVLRIQSNGIDRTDKDMVHSILTIGFTAADDGAGVIDITLAGDGAIALHVEALEATLRDVTKPYLAPSKKTPQHQD